MRRPRSRVVPVRPRRPDWLFDAESAYLAAGCPSTSTVGGLSAATVDHLRAENAAHTAAGLPAHLAHPSDPPADLSGVEKARFVDPNPFRNEK